MYHVICGGAHNGGRPTVHSMVARRWPAGSGAVRGSRGGGAGRLCRGDAGVSGVVILLQLERALRFRPTMPSQMCSASAYTAAVTIRAMWCERKLDGWKRE